MNRLALLCLGALLPLGLSAAMLQNVTIPAPAGVMGFTNLTPSTANSVALDTKLPALNPTARIYASWMGDGTNTLTFVSTGDGINWDSVASSSFVLSGADGKASGWFNFVGVKNLGLGAVTNALGATSSNLSIRLFYAPQ